MEHPAVADDPVSTGATIAPAGLLRRGLVATFRRLMRLYFREVERVGHAPGPDTRGRVIVSNHQNALIDPVLVITGADCDISPVAKSTLWNVPGLRWLLDRAGAVPIVRRKDSPDKSANANDATFESIAAHLSGGGNLLIFPEGTSHSEPHLAPLRTGAARMLLAAEAKGGTPVTFQAAALEFDNRSDFRSRTLVLWGPVRRFADIPGDPEARVRAATQMMDADLRELLVEGTTHEERRRIARVAELLANDTEAGSTLERWNGIGRQVELASRTLHTVDDKLVARVGERVDAYYDELARLGLADAHVAGLAHTPAAPAEAPATTAPWKRLLRSPLAATGVALYALPYFLPRWLARKADEDAVSTFKLGAGLVVYPLWAAGLVGGSLLLLPPPISLAAATLALVSPFAALRWLDVYYQRPGHATPDEFATLARLRIAARTAIDEARARLPS